jgi:hypothetical protein
MESIDEKLVPTQLRVSDADKGNRYIDEACISSAASNVS